MRYTHRKICKEYKLDIPTLVQNAVSAFKSRNRKVAVSSIAKLIELRPALSDDWGAIARMAATMLETKLALKAAILYAESFPNDVQKALNAAGLMAEVGALKEALALIKPFLEKNPDAAPLLHFVGMVKSQLGDQEGADICLRKTLAIWPTSGQTWLMLSAMKKFKKDDKDFIKMKEGVPLVDAAPISQQIPFYYAYGKALLDVGDLDAAMTAYEKASQMVTQERGAFNAQSDRQFVDHIIAEHTVENFAQLQASGNTSTRPIFVIGLPRSGTTLLEQILTSHPDVVDGAELNFMSNAAVDIGGYSFSHLKAYEQKTLPGNGWQDIADIYLSLMDSRYGAEGRIVDKSLNNSRYVGLIRHIFPKAPIIWIRRNPLDVAWSCYRTYFNAGMTWSFNFSNIAKFLMAEDALYKHWTSLYPNEILTVPYEGLVADQDKWFDTIFDHIGLATTPEVKNFHENKRAVLTASVGQVRSPIHNKSVGSAEKLGDYIKPFTDIYT